MSDYGLILKNNSGEIQIDSTYRNLSLDESGDSETISNDNTQSGFYTGVSITSSPLVPLILIRPDTDRFVAIGNYSKSSDNFTGVDFVTEAGTSTDIDWKSYRENREASGDTYGMLVYNSSGQLCFDSGKSYFKIKSITTGIELDDPSPGFGLVSDYQDITHSGISDPYYIVSPSAFWLITWQHASNQSGLQLYLIGIKKLTSTSVRVGWFPYRAGVMGGMQGFNQGSNPTMKLLVCAP